MGRLFGFVVFATVFAGCFGSGMESAARRTGQNPRSDGVLDLASKETGCPVNDLRIVAETGRRYVNETAFRFVLEGCGERFGFVEQCEVGSAGGDAIAVNDSLSCRFLLVTRLSLAPRAVPSPSSVPPAPAATGE
jgi:hypothetical protein